MYVHIFYYFSIYWSDTSLRPTDRTSFEVCKAQIRLSLHLSKCHIVGNHIDVAAHIVVMAIT